MEVPPDNLKISGNIKFYSEGTIQSEKAAEGTLAITQGDIKGSITVGDETGEVIGRVSGGVYIVTLCIKTLMDEELKGSMQESLLVLTSDDNSIICDFEIYSEDSSSPCSPSEGRAFENTYSDVRNVLSKAGIEQRDLPTVADELEKKGITTASELSSVSARSLRESGVPLKDSGSVLAHAEVAAKQQENKPDKIKPLQKKVLGVFEKYHVVKLASAYYRKFSAFRYVKGRSSSTGYDLQQRLAFVESQRDGILNKIAEDGRSVGETERMQAALQRELALRESKVKEQESDRKKLQRKADILSSRVDGLKTENQALSNRVETLQMQLLRKQQCEKSVLIASKTPSPRREGSREPEYRPQVLKPIECPVLKTPSPAKNTTALSKGKKADSSFVALRLIHCKILRLYPTVPAAFSKVPSDSSGLVKVSSLRALFTSLSILHLLPHVLKKAPEEGKGLYPLSAIVDTIASGAPPSAPQRRSHSKEKEESFKL
eukprot:TRINITY_DN6722_c0_g1_i1.p1 TRINITY_DN6722_c0_g1~~TRINITY_DN6722_c0_g1_i1.p1  ORF type:complete len:510 (+),score=75.70 TRINITY_DN6722_c0_g1_i1:65-1531(+)